MSPGYSCSFHTVWCQKGYSPSISHSDLIHLSPLMCYSCGEVGESLYSLKGCQRRIITLLPLVSHMHTHKSSGKTHVSTCICRHTHAHTPSPGGKVTNFKRLDTCSHFPLLSLPLSPSASLYTHLSIACSLLLPHLSSHREKFIHSEERNHLQVWREDPVQVTLCPCKKCSTIAFES